MFVSPEANWSLQDCLVRQLHNTHWGLVCPAETPEGQAWQLGKKQCLKQDAQSPWKAFEHFRTVQAVGLVKNIALMCCSKMIQDFYSTRATNANETWVRRVTWGVGLRSAQLEAWNNRILCHSKYCRLLSVDVSWHACKAQKIIEEFLDDLGVLCLVCCGDSVEIWANMQKASAQSIAAWNSQISMYGMQKPFAHVHGSVPTKWYLRRRKVV